MKTEDMLAKTVEDLEKPLQTEVFSAVPDRALDKMVSIDLHFKGETKFNKADFDRLQKTVFKDVVYLRETNPGHFHIEEGHAVIGQAMSDKVNLVPVWFEKRDQTVEKFNLNLTTYQLEPLNDGDKNNSVTGSE